MTFQQQFSLSQEGQFGIANARKVMYPTMQTSDSDIAVIELDKVSWGWSF